MRSLLCVPITVHSKADALADAGAAREQGASLVELRMDHVIEAAGVQAGIELSKVLVGRSSLPVIVTCRSVAEGGTFGGTLEDLEAWTRAMLEGAARPRYVDVEFGALGRSGVLRSLVREHDDPGRPGVILSMHDFSGPPRDLSRRLLAMCQTGGVDVIKVACTARSLRDALAMLSVPGELARPTIALSMGEFGVLSRVLAPKFGGFLTFASLRDGAATAPGQPTIGVLRDQYGFDAIGGATRVYGVIGWPVAHSRSPLVHNAGFRGIGFEGVYLPLPVASDEDPETAYVSFKATVLELMDHPGLNFGGASVTIPHKENLARLARELGWEADEATRAIGAANTLVMAPGAGAGRPVVLNTDAPALVECLERVAGGLAGKRCVVLGAGGVARAAAWGLVRAGASVGIINRSRAKADQLVSDLVRANPGARVGVATLGEMEQAACVVNATSVGMAGGPAPGSSPLDAGSLARIPAGAVVMDTVYVPRETGLIRAAKGRGLRVVTGDAMFVAQAGRQFEAWTGRAAPAGLFDRLLAGSIGEAGGKP